MGKIVPCLFKWLQNSVFIHFRTEDPINPVTVLLAVNSG